MIPPNGKPGSRKVRKGTFSCWECKRRKTRCHFQSVSSTVCMSCSRHGVPCVSQESEEPVENADEANEKRLAHIETLVNQLVQQRNVHSRKNPPMQSLRDSGEVAHQSLSKKHRTTATTSTHGSLKTSRRDAIQSSLGLIRITEDSNSRCSSLCDYFQSILPHSSTAELIFSNGQSPLAILEQSAKLVGSCTTAIRQSSLIRRTMAMARNLVQLALCLERLSLRSSEIPGLHLAASNGTIARQYVNAASHLTCHDCFMGSLEGVELLMLQSSFETSVGNLRTAWLTIRRAFNLAQVMKWPQSTAQTWLGAKLTWLRLIHFDRVLSLMLGQRSSSEDCHLRDVCGLPDVSPSPALESVYASISGRIITRNLHMGERIQRGVRSGDIYDDYEETRDLDHELKRSMRSLPTDWWNQTSMPSRPEDAARLVDQLHHYDLLVLVHLPYLIYGPHRQSWSDICESSFPGCTPEYSRFAAVSASREVLTRILLCGKNRHVPCSLTGLNHKSFTASVALLLAHIGGHSLGYGNVLEHQRPFDVKIVREAIDLMAEATRLSSAIMSSWNSEVLKELLAIEEDAANGNTYTICVSNDFSGQLSGEPEQDGPTLQFSMPYLGMIQILRQQEGYAQPTDTNFELNWLIDDSLVRSNTFETRLEQHVNNELDVVPARSHLGMLWTLSPFLKPADWLGVPT